MMVSNLLLFVIKGYLLMLAFGIVHSGAHVVPAFGFYASLALFMIFTVISRFKIELEITRVEK